MFSFIVSKAYGMGAASPGGAGMEAPPFYAQPFFIMILLLVIFYIFLLYPQRKERKRHEARLKALEIGDKIITSGGIHGIITNASGDPLKVKISDNVKIDISRNAIVNIQSGQSLKEDKKEDKSK